MKYSIFKMHPSDFIYLHFISIMTKIFISTLILVLKYSSQPYKSTVWHFGLF